MQYPPEPKPSDIAEAIRSAMCHDNCGCADSDWCINDLAAAEIERLEAEIDDERQAHQVCVEMRNAAVAEIERLWAPFRGVDSFDWAFLMGALPDGGRGRFWKAVLQEMRAALEQGATEPK